jgi:uncharacterized protein with von Willebrand factor type A (vWA) domain
VSPSDRDPPPPPSEAPGGVVHAYHAYDPRHVPPPLDGGAGDGPDLVGAAFDRLLFEGRSRPLSPEELADAVKIDPRSIAGLGPSLDDLIARLEARRDRILAAYRLDRARQEASDRVDDRADRLDLPEDLDHAVRKELSREHLRGLERLWRRLPDGSEVSQRLMGLIAALGDRFEIERIGGRWTFHGPEEVTLARGLELGEELDRIEALLKQLREARRNARVGLVDLDELRDLLSAEDAETMAGLQRQVNELLQAVAEQQGLEAAEDGFRLTPKAWRTYQSRLLAAIFADLREGRRGRHDPVEAGDGAIESPQVRPWAFGDSLAGLDVGESVVEAAVRGGGAGPIRLQSEDLRIFKSRHRPKAATVVILDMSGSMRQAGQYVHCKRMALALDGLIRQEYPGDVLRFISMDTLARVRTTPEVAELLPRPVTIRNPVVRLRADLSDPELDELDLPLHFTNIQRSLELARRLLSGQDADNRQVILITDGLPTAHCEGNDLYMLYPPDPRTETATLREGRAAAREGIVINVMLLPSWSQTEEDVRFADRLASDTGGRLFHVGGEDLDRFVVWDYHARRRLQL